MSKMYEKYKKIFNIYLEILQEDFKSEDSTENMKNCCKRCESFRDQLLGMLYLMQEMDKIPCEMRKEEWDKVLETFSSIKLFGIYVRDGKLYGRD